LRVHYDNIVFSLQKAGGISTYWSELISRLLRDETEVFFEEFTHDNIVRQTLSIKEETISFQHKKYLILERFTSLKLARHQQPFIFHSSYHRMTSNPYALQVSTVHDFVHEKFYKGLRRSLHLLQKNRMLKAADRIITVSENTKKDLLEFHPGIPEENIKVIYNGVSADFYPLEPGQLASLKLDSDRPYILFIGSREHYKNFSFTVNLLSELPDFDLYIVGGKLSGAEKQNLMQQIPGRWRLFSHVGNQRLNELYNLAYTLIYPSQYEGFGIPLLEAMKAGTPFLALRSSSIPEVAGKAGLLLESADLELFKKTLLNVDVQRNRLRALGFAQAAKFSWEHCYQQTLSLYKDLSRE